MRVLSICLLAACSYTPATGEIAPDAETGQLPNDPPPPSPDASVTLDAPPQVTCTTSDSSLALCLEFEDTTQALAIDGSGHGHDAAINGTTPITRDVPASSRALTIANGSIMVGDSSDLDSQTLTISAWVRRTSKPAAGQRYGIVDIGRKQAALAIDDDGNVVCMVRTEFDIWVGTGGVTSANEWSLVACTYDAPDLCMYVFKNGSAEPSVECGSTDGAALDVSVNAGGAIGALFDTANQPVSKLAGAVDSIRIYSRALTEKQLCEANGLSGC